MIAGGAGFSYLTTGHNNWIEPERRSTGSSRLTLRFKPYELHLKHVFTRQDSISYCMGRNCGNDLHDHQFTLPYFPAITGYRFLQRQNDEYSKMAT